MKKSLTIIALAVSAMSISSCAPGLSKADAKVQADAILNNIENSQMPAGQKFVYTYRVDRETLSGGDRDATHQEGYIHIDMENLYARFHETYTETLVTSGATTTATVEQTMLVYYKDSTIFTGELIKEDDVITSSVTDSIQTDTPKEASQAIFGIYDTVTNIFKTAISAIMAYVNSFYTDEQLKAAGVSFTSEGDGNLTIIEKFNVTQGNVSRMGDTKISFDAYMLTEMKSIYENKVGNDIDKGDLLYKFQYDECPIDYNF